MFVRIVNNNNNMKKIFELEQKLKELGGERQKVSTFLFSQKFKFCL